METAMRALFCVAGSVVMFLGCSSGFRIVPAPSATPAGALESAAIGSDAGVQIVAEADAWTGRPEVVDEITPMRITISNQSGRLLRIRYSDFVLVNEKGQRYAALPPYAITGTIDEQRLVGPFPSFGNPAFEYDGFRVAPYCAPVYPGIPSYQDTFYLDPSYYSRYYSVWTSVQLPTEEMLRRVLPDGVLEDRGRVSGFLYFQRVLGNERELTFSAELIDATNGERLGRISVPFVVLRT